MEMDEHHVAEVGNDFEDVPKQPGQPLGQLADLQQPHHLGQGERSQRGPLFSGGGAGAGVWGRAHFALLPAWLPGQSREWQGQKHMDSL